MRHFEPHLVKLYESLVDHPGKWIFAWILIVAGLIGALADHTNNFTQLDYHSGPYIYFTEDNSDFETLVRMEKTFAPDTSVMFIYSPKQGDIFNQQSLQIIEEITEIAWTLPYVMRVDSLSNFQHTEVAGDELHTDYLYENAGRLTEAEIAKVKRIALSEKTLQRQTISNNGDATTVVATVTIDEAQTQALELMPVAKQVVADLEKKYPDAEFMLLGDVPFAEAAHMATNETMSRTTPLAMTLVLVCLIILLRNLYSVVATQVMIALSIGIGYSIFILADATLSPISAGASPIILTLAVADCVHILVTYHQQCGLGKSKRDAMLESLRLNFSPVWLTSITTGIGFLMMNFAESPPFHDLGNAVFIGVMMAFFLSVFLLPPVMMYLPKPSYQFGANQTRYMQGLAKFSIKNRTQLLWGMSLLVLACIALLPLNRVNDILTEYYDETYEVRQALDFYVDNVGGIQRLAYVIPSKGPGGITDPEYLQNLDKLVSWSETHPHVSHIRSFVEVVKRLNRNMHDGDLDYYKVPEERELIAQYVLLYELGLPFGLGLDTQVDIDKSETKLEIVFNHVRSYELVSLREEVEQWMQNNWPEYMHASATGMDSLFSDITFENVYSMVFGTIMALVLVSSLLVLTLRSFRYGLLSLLPNLLPAAMTFGIWGVIDGEVGLVVSIIACMTLGIIIDDTVHFLSKYVRAKREMGLDAEEAAVYAFETVGVALIATSIILVANFAVMGSSHYYPSAATGTLTSMTITLALVIHFFFFVPLLLTLDKKPKRPIEAKLRNDRLRPVHKAA